MSRKGNKASPANRVCRGFVPVRQLEVYIIMTNTVCYYKLLVPCLLSTLVDLAFLTNPV